MMENTAAGDHSACRNDDQRSGQVVDGFRLLGSSVYVELLGTEGAELGLV